jgi:hypothetical protein
MFLAVKRIGTKGLGPRGRGGNREPRMLAAVGTSSNLGAQLSSFRRRGAFIEAPPADERGGGKDGPGGRGNAYRNAPSRCLHRRPSGNAYIAVHRLYFGSFAQRARVVQARLHNSCSHGSPTFRSRVRPRPTSRMDVVPSFSARKSRSMSSTYASFLHRSRTPCPGAGWNGSCNRTLRSLKGEVQRTCSKRFRP